jgi:hypothetical protein
MYSLSRRLWVWRYKEKYNNIEKVRHPELVSGSIFSMRFYVCFTKFSRATAINETAFGAMDPETSSG